MIGRCAEHTGMRPAPNVTCRARLSSAANARLESAASSRKEAQALAIGRDGHHHALK